MLRIAPHTAVPLLAALLGAAPMHTAAQKFLTSHNRYAGRYAYEELGQERVRATWYHYVTSQAEDGSYIVRVFHPDIAQLTERTHYADPQHLVEHGTQHLWWDNGQPRAVGHFDQNVKSGFGVYWDPGGSQRHEGLESASGKQGLWTEWRGNDSKAAEITYRNGVREGPFVLYDTLGAEKARGRYEKGVIVEIDNDAGPEQVEEVLPGWQGCDREAGPSALSRCRDERLYRFLAQHLNYPKKAIDLGIEGQALVAFTITRTGEIKDPTVLSGLCREIENECLRVLELMPPWDPGYQRGKPVAVRFNLPFKFTLR